MSDAPAAPVNANGVPPAAQEKVEEAPGFKVFVGNLAYSTTDDGLKAFFAPVENDLLTAQVIFRGTRSAGYGFVSLNSAESVQKAIELLDKKELDGRELIVEVAKPADQKEAKKERHFKRKPGRRGAKPVPGEVTESEANGELVKYAEGAAPAAGEEAAKPKKKKANRKARARKAAAAEGDAEGAEGSPEGATTEGEGAAKKPRQRKPRPARPPRPAGEEPAGEPSKTHLFIANLGFNITDEELSAIFTDADIKVNSARIVRRRWGKPRKSKGFGFVDVGDEEQQKKAIELLNGKEIGGRPIAVKVAVNSQHEEEDEASATEEKVEVIEAPATAVAVTAVAAAPAS